MTAFESIVALCRLSVTKDLAGSDLILHLARSEQVPGLVAAVEGGAWRLTVQVDGREVMTGVDGVQVGGDFVLVVHGVARADPVIVKNIGGLLSYSMGSFLGVMPQNFYLLQEDYASGDLPVHRHVQAYERCIELLQLLKGVADDYRTEVGSAGRAIILTSRKLEIPVIYKQWVLDEVAEGPELEAFKRAAFDEHLASGRKDVLRRVLVRFLFNVAESERFEVFVKSWKGVYAAFLSDFDIYASGFNFDKAREEFERKKLDFIVKMNGASSDAMSKLIAIPVGQGLLASQMKIGPEYAIVNNALLLSSVVFAIIAIMLIVVHALTITQVKTELATEEGILKERARTTYDQLRPVIQQLSLRIRVHQIAVPCCLVLLLGATTALTWVAYAQLARS